MPAITERLGEVDKPRWTANLEEYGPQALTTDCGPPLTYMYIPEVQNVESAGQKCNERSTSSTFLTLLKNTTVFRVEVQGRDNQN